MVLLSTKNSVVMTACIAASWILSSASAFAPASSSSSGPSTALFAEPVEQGRRAMLSKSFGAAMGILTAGVVAAGNPEEASATYTSFTNRELDWEERNKNGEIQISTARSLRSQLREIAPMNSESSRMFCPNGPSAAVSPLMENRCGDRQATVSVFGRTQDVAGNSIPGFSGGRAAPLGGGTIQVGSGVADIGGFPAYKPY